MSARPHLRISNVAVYVKDQDRSIAFFVEKLGFRLLHDALVPPGFRWVIVAPPDGDACLLLASAGNTPRSSAEVFFVSDDVPALYRNWLAKGVVFPVAPAEEEWGGIHATFEDPDGNVFHLAQSDYTTAQISAERRAAQERQEQELRHAQEMDFAARVQAKLFPQRRPDLHTLNYAGVCQQARQVGGDYYDYFQVGPGRVAFVIGDVSGKGMAAALLMANLQATLRGQCISASEELAPLLQGVNQMFFENTPETSYASLFFAVYDDNTRRLRYVNCGHLPPLLRRNHGVTGRLMPTGGLLGMFPHLDAEEDETEIGPGDRLLLYTDGATECCNPDGVEFGEDGLLTYLDRDNLALNESLTDLLRMLDEFDGPGQSDDITLVMAEGRLR